MKPRALRLLHSGLVLILLPLALAGCDKAAPATPPMPPRTGAEEIARQYFEALMRQDWTTAYSLLDPGSQASCGSARFAALGQHYHEGIGFEPTEASVTVTEMDSTATAVVVYRAVSGTGTKQFRDGASLQRTPTGWAVTLRKNFGKGPAAKPGKG